MKRSLTVYDQHPQVLDLPPLNAVQLDLYRCLMSLAVSWTGLLLTAETEQRDKWTAITSQTTRSTHLPLTPELPVCFH